MRDTRFIRGMALFHASLIRLALWLNGLILSLMSGRRVAGRGLSGVHGDAIPVFDHGAVALGAPPRHPGCAGRPIR
jgi:hypothetical protein